MHLRLVVPQALQDLCCSSEQTDRTNVPCHRRPACLPQHLPCTRAACPAHLCRGRQCPHAAVHVLQQGLQLLLAELAFEVQVCQGTAAGSTKGQGPNQACKPVPGESTRTQSHAA